MKGLASLSSAQRAKIIHELFPECIADFLAFTTGIIEKIKMQREQLDGGDEQIFPAVQWVGMAEHTATAIQTHEGKLEKNASLFSEELFHAECAFFTKHCLVLFVSKAEYKGSKFRIAVELLYN